MTRILFYFVLCSMALAGSEILYTQNQIVIVNNKENLYTHYGRTFFNAEVYFMWQKNFFQDFICKFWLDRIQPFTLHDFNCFARVYVPWPKPWVVLNITEEQYRDWEATGELHTVEYIESKKINAEIKAAVAADRQTAIAMMELSALKYYISPSGVWHVDPNCPDNVGTIEISPLDVLKYENRKACTKCTGVK